MQLSFAATAKRVIKMTGKARAALEEKSLKMSSKKRKNDGGGDSANTHLKKAQNNLQAGNTPTGSVGSADEDELVEKNSSVTASRTVSMSPCPDSVSSRRALHCITG
ncbi:uncharacterized protein HD556DRAFT_1306615 [Suillus plorans]|uniref:Uncharacterized protein n=1 Tax=Suillus plorans TaxID=116603 RepID=A0A9P7DL51_9AGAM|nr:uncharacterized protein HD556DRAFT_1306615 [Suillus plorans]KAG1797487.1 hypothetical protein HD556DRAFT_1306615 [Suillus plorans]